MGTKPKRDEKLGFLDSIGALLGRGRQPEAAKPEQPAEPLSQLEAEFSAAIGALDQKVEELRRAAPRPASERSRPDRLAERQKRMEAAHRGMREDIEKMHAQLGTDLAAADLDALAHSMRQLESLAGAGRDSHELMLRSRFAIAMRLQHEAGEQAVTRLIALLERAAMPWPDPNYWPKATPEQVEQSQRRRRAEVREAFLGQGFERTAERLVGIVQTWADDYPERDSLLWQETVLEGVAAGIRARLVEQFVGALRADRQLLLDRVEETIGEQVAALRAAVAQGVHSIQQANLAMASALRAVDEVVPEIAWQQLCEKLPLARGEAPA